MCKVSHDQHHEFGIRGREFIDKYIPDMSYSTYRNNLSILVRNGLLVKVQHGADAPSTAVARSLVTELFHRCSG